MNSTIVDMTNYIEVDRAVRYTERNAQRLTNALSKLIKDGKSETYLRPLMLEVNHIGSVLAAGGACDRAGN